MARLEQLGIATNHRFDNSSILTLAERHRLTAYDAAYLAVALDRTLPIATLDRRLAEAAERDSLVLE